jgi:hypothetical protein
MIDQVIAQHHDAKYFHIGLDEVYYKLTHPNCSFQSYKSDFTEAFMVHLIRVAKHVRQKLPNSNIIIWDDMLQGMDETIIEKYVYYIIYSRN